MRPAPPSTATVAARVTCRTVQRGGDHRQPRAAPDRLHATRQSSYPSATLAASRLSTQMTRIGRERRADPPPARPGRSGLCADPFPVFSSFRSVLAFPAAALAQRVTGQIIGTVTDPIGRGAARRHRDAARAGHRGRAVDDDQHQRPVPDPRPAPGHLHVGLQPRRICAPHAARPSACRWARRWRRTRPSRCPLSPRWSPSRAARPWSTPPPTR